MTVHRNAHDEKVSLEEYFAILEKDPEHRYEYLDGDVYIENTSFLEEQSS